MLSGANIAAAKWASIADMTVFSFHPVKHITTGEGGMVTTNSPDLPRRYDASETMEFRAMRGNGRAAGQWHYEMVQLGFNYRLPDIVCALGIRQLKKLDANLSRRREIALRYSELFVKSWRHSLLR